MLWALLFQADDTSTYPGPLAFVLAAVPLFLQAVLLHPRVPDFPILRLLLSVPGVILSLLTPIWFQFNPVELSIPANLRWGMFGTVFAMRSLEWGLVCDRAPYTWVGVSRMKEVEEEEASAKRASSAPVAEEKTPPTSEEEATKTLIEPPVTLPDAGVIGEARKMREEEDYAGSVGIVRGEARTSGGTGAMGSTSQADSVHDVAGPATQAPPLPFTVLADSLHLLASLRGIGYAFGPPSRCVAPMPRMTNRDFAVRCLRRFALHHVIATLAVMFLAERHALMAHTANPVVRFAIALTSHLLIGVCIHSQVYVGTEQLALYSLGMNVLLRAVLPSAFRPAPFDSREYPPAFNNPLVPLSLAHFWSAQWHALFRSQFVVLGFRPATAVGRAMGSRIAGRILGIVVVFAYSALMHDYGFHTALYHSRVPVPETYTWVERNGNSIYFMSQAAGVLLERILLSGFPRGHRVHVLYSYFFVVGLGLFAAHTWLLFGAADPIPRVASWSWERFVLPSASLLPMSVFTR